jgi:hypothetical protein
MRNERKIDIVLGTKLRCRVYIILKGKRRTLTWWWRRFWDYEFEYWIQHPRPVSVRIRWCMAALTTCCLVSGTAIWWERERENPLWSMLFQLSQNGLLFVYGPEFSSYTYYKCGLKKIFGLEISRVEYVWARLDSIRIGSV